MTEKEPGRRRWLRPLGLLVIALMLTMGQPVILVVVTFAILTFLGSVERRAGAGIGSLFVAGLMGALVFAGEPSGAMWYVERGWAILAGGAFAAVSLAWPRSAFLPRGIAAVAGATVWAGLVILARGGWGVIEGLIVNQIRTSVATTAELVGALGGTPSLDQGLLDTLNRTAEVQGVLFPALLALSTLASLGVAWWLHVRVTGKSDGGLGSLRQLRFPDPMIWLFIAGAALVLVAEWSVGWGRLGTNLLAFSGGLYVLRGAGVLLFMAGGLSFWGGLFLLLAMVFAAPILAAGAMALGMGDSWFDFRARLDRNDGGG